MNLYCRSYEEVICRDCTIVSHKSHDYTIIKSAKDKQVKQMENVLVEVGAKKVKFAGHRVHLERVEQGSTV